MDARKTLEQLEEEWKTCEKCELGVRRRENEREFVFGEGVRRGILFVGEGPGGTEEQEGRPFIGPSGKLLRGVLDKMKFTDYYFTNCVACRSCAPAYDNLGQPIVRLNKRTGAREHIIRDEAPKPVCIQACLSRLYEQIYLIDPVLIVGLGAEASKTLKGRPVSITAERGNLVTVQIPGAWKLPSITEKKKVWLRKVGGAWVMPTVPNTIEYSMIMTLHPSYVLRTLEDRRPGNPLEQFVDDVKKAVNTYNRYLTEAYGQDFIEAKINYEEVRYNEDEND